MSTASELREKSVDDLQSQILDLKKEQFNLRFQKATGQLENTAQIRVVRREIARLQTVINEKRAAEAAANA